MIVLLATPAEDAGSTVREVAIGARDFIEGK